MDPTRSKGFIYKFQQQKLPGYYFMPGVKGVLYCTGFCWLILIIFGIINIAATNKLQEVCLIY